jgi:formylglycine-generating enzyme required for sulfatase activity
MADIFISYAHEDQARIRGLVSALEEQGWSIFWDTRIPAGKTWQNYIGRALSDAKCVIVAWSPHSIISDWVIEEANDGKKRGRLIPVLLDSVEPPLGFRGIQAADLTDWKPGSSSYSFDQLTQDIAGVVGGKPLRATPDEAVTPTKPEPYKVQPRKPEPPEPGKKRPNLLIGAVIGVAIAIFAGWALWSSREPRPLERVVESPVAKAPEAPTKAPAEEQKPEVKPPEPKAVPAKPVSKPAVKPAEPQVTPPKLATEAPIQRAFTNRIGMSFVLIPAGSFTMGSPTSEPGRYDNEQQHRVTISKHFYLQTTEVTQKQWKQVMGSNPSSFKDCGDDCPVDSVSWNDAQEFIQKLNQMESGAKYRLPTEAEWEYACRAGSKGRFYFGDEEAKLGEYAWYGGNSGGKTHPVGKKKPNDWGLYDMYGNVFEWVEDDYHESYTGVLYDERAWIDSPRGSYRVIRGGGWSLDARYCRSATRLRYRPDIRDYDLGFRLSRSVALGP